MIKSRILPLFFSVWLLLTGELARAQRLTNTPALQEAARDIGKRQKDLHVRLLGLSRQNGWPLTLRNMKGRMAYLRGIDAGGAPIYITTDENIISAATIRTNQLWPGGSTGLALSGSTADLKNRLAMWDEGDIRSTHVELTGRVNNMDNLAISDHSTHVAGTLIAAGVNPLAKGMSFGAPLLQAGDFDNDISEMFSLAPNLLVSNHSYGDVAGWFQNASENNRWEFYGSPGDTSDFKFGVYDTNSQLWDSAGYNAPHYLIFKAAGNNRNVNGPPVGQDYFRPNSLGTMQNAGARPAGISNNDAWNTIATEGDAKNIITMGAVNPIPGGYSQSSDVVMTNFSSWGPTADGRIKPDLVADGVDVLSSFGGADNAYNYLSGTSMSTPAAAGSSLLLQEYYKKLHGVYMLSSTLKGLLIHTADEAGAFPGPDYIYGWGLIDMQKAASVITSDNSAAKDQQIVEATLTNTTHDADSYAVVASGKTPLVATIAWIDPPAKPSTGIHVDNSIKLIDDLDLRISDGTTTYSPWVLNPANLNAAATTGDNFRDNVEKVEVDSLVPGKAYTIKITHKGVLARVSQTYSLLISGIGGQAYCASSSGGAGGTRIDQVTLSNLSNPNTAGCKSYSDFTGVAAARLPVGQTLPISIVYNSCTSATTTNIAVYIDFNNNGSFSDPGELVLLNSSLLASGTGNATFSGNITIPASAVPGSYSRMRIIAEDNGALATPAPCGSYPNGETQDYRVLFTNPSADVGVTQLEYPTLTTCANDSQVVAIRIHNFGTTAQTSVPVTTVITNSSGTVATLSAICKDSIAPGSEVVFTYPSSFASVGATTYTFTSKTALSGDLNTANDQNITTLTVNADEGAPTGSTATICSSTPGSVQVSLVTNSGENDIPVWYTSPTGGSPIATGSNTSTTVIPSNDTYYVGLNDLSTNKVPPISNQSINSGAGSYFGLEGNYTSISTSVPLTIESARLYVGNSGKVRFTLATLISSSFANGYQYIPLYATTIDVAATVASPSPNTINVAAGNNTDQGALYYLNIPIPVPGNYIIITDCQDNSTLFLSQNNTALPYPFTLPGLISLNGTYITDSNPVDSTTFPKKVYFPFYDMGVRLSGCPSPRVAVVATAPVAPTIILTGDSLISSVVNGNQWYLSGAPISGAIYQIDTALLSGLYKTVVSDGGCALSSNTIDFQSNGSSSGSTIGFVTVQNPSDKGGNFQLKFFVTTRDNTTVSLTDMLGQVVFLAAYPDFLGQFNQAINAGALASGIYVMQIRHGKDMYQQKILIAK
jgi:Subtilase family/GEVED domain/Ig-like domain CHU_C associated/Secretion system C-terminal sorting domain